MNLKRTAETPWALVPSLKPELPTLWFASRMAAENYQSNSSESYFIQYRPKRKAVKR